MQKLKYNCIIVMVLIIVVFTSIFWAFQKCGMHIDEIYTFGLSNSHYAPFITSLKDGDMNDKVFTKQEFWDYMTVADDKFDFGSVYYNQSQDTLPPLYYWIINVISSIWSGKLLKWPPLIFNIILYVLTLIFLYAICMNVCRDTRISSFCVFLYGMSRIGLSTVLFIRMYMLLTFFTVLFTYLILLLLNQRKLRYCMLISLIIFAGMMTHYYFAIYAGITCLFVDIYFAVKKEYRQLAIFSCFAAIGVILMLLAFPAFFSQFSANKVASGTSIIDSMKDWSKCKGNILYYVIETIDEMKIGILIGIFAVLLCFFRNKRIMSLIKQREVDLKYLTIILPPAISIVITGIMSSFVDMRYVYHIMPILMIVLCYILSITRIVYNRSYIGKVFYALSLISIAIAFFGVYRIGPEYIFKEHKKYNDIVDQYSNFPCVYITDNFNAPMTQSLMQLVKFDDVYVTNDVKLSGINQYVKEHKETDRIVAYIDVNKFWSSGYNAKEKLDEIIEITEYDKYEFLYKTGLSELYLLTSK